MKFLLFIFLSLNVFANKNIPIKVSAITNWGAPLMVFNQENKPQSGIVFDTVNLIMKKADIKFEWVVLPRQRVEEELFNGGIDLRAYASPSWSQNPQKILWSKKLFEVKNIISRFKDAPKINTLEDLAGKKLGTTNGYVYPSLIEYFASKNLKRVDSGSEDTTLKMLSTNRVSYAISNNLALNNYFKINKDSMIEPTSIELDSTEIFFGGIPKNKALINQLNKAIVELNKNKEIDNIISKYK